METILFITGILLLITGLIGCVVPFIPGPPLAYLALLLTLVYPPQVQDLEFYLLWAIITATVTLMDYYIPIVAARRFGGTRLGVRGALAGLFVGIFIFPPFGIIIGPLVGAFIGELLGGNKFDVALRSAFGSFIGFLAGTVMKITVVLLMGYYFVIAFI